jgi:hypothetical protein
MKETVFEVLAKAGPLGQGMADELDRFARDLVTVLAGCDAPTRELFLGSFMVLLTNRLREADDKALNGSGTITRNGHAPDSPTEKGLLEWAKRQFTDEEILAGLQEIRKTGGQEIGDLLRQLEGECRPPA